MDLLAKAQSPPVASATRYPEPNTRSPKSDPRNLKSEGQNPNPETRNPKPETRKPNPETCSRSPFSARSTPTSCSRSRFSSADSRFDRGLYWVGTWREACTQFARGWPESSTNILKGLVAIPRQESLCGSVGDLFAVLFLGAKNAHLMPPLPLLFSQREHLRLQLA